LSVFPELEALVCGVDVDAEDQVPGGGFDGFEVVVVG
jgi:hypothetical protein